MNREKYISILEDFSNAELTAKDFCERHQINYKTLQRWAKRLDYDIRSHSWHRGKHPHSQNLVPTNRQSHGVYSFIQTGLVPCGGCIWRAECDHYEPGESCAVLAEFQSSKMAEIMALDHIKDQDAPMVEMAVREMAIQALIMRFTSRVGLFKVKDKTVSLQPVMNQYWCSVNALSRILSKLGLDPLSRKQLGTDRNPYDVLAMRMAGMIDADGKYIEDDDDE